MDVFLGRPGVQILRAAELSEAFCERCFRQRYILVAALILALPIYEKAPMDVNIGELVRQREIAVTQHDNK